MRFCASPFFFLLILCLEGCASYPRFPSQSSTTAEQLMRDFGLDQRHTAVDLEQLGGNTLKAENKVFITDRSIQKRYFGLDGLLFFQDDGMIAYGFIPIPVGDVASEGSVNPYKMVDGVVITSACQEPERILVTTERGSGEYACWIKGCHAPEPSWSKWDCTIERGNTLRATRH